MRLSWRSTAALAAGAVVSLGLLAASPAVSGPGQAVGGAQAAPQFLASAGQWPVAGQNTTDDHYQPDETIIGPRNADKLTQKWVFTTAPGTGVWATPTEADGIAYFPAMADDEPGYLYAVNVATGRQIWSDYIPALSPELPAVAATRNSPAIFGNELIFGDQHKSEGPGTGAHLMAVNRFTGKLDWITTIDSNSAAQVTASVVVSGNVAYTGIASNEQTQEIDNPSFKCCTFRGSVVAVNALTGKILWKTYMVPPNGGKPGGYTGDAVWGSTPVVDRKTGMLYVGTGDNYTVPAGICQEASDTGCSPPAPDDYLDSVVAMNLRTGKIEWTDQTLTANTWPVPGAVDYDFGSGPNLFTTMMDGKPRTLLGLGQKSGTYWAVNPVTGAVAWDTQVGPGSAIGGIEFGSATDGNRIYIQNSNLNHVKWKLQGSGPEGGQTVTGGFWTALDPATGKILWQTLDPQSEATDKGYNLDMGFVSVANGVVYVGAGVATGDNMYALDSATGAILWRFASGGSVLDAPAILNGLLLWGSGYHVGTENNKMYAFGLG